MKNFTSLLGTFRVQYILVTVFAAAVTGSEAVLHPLLMKAIFDAVELRVDFGHFIQIGIYYFALGVIINILSYLVSVLQMRLDNRIVAQVSADLLRAYYAKNYDNILKQGAGYYVARIRSDVKDGLVPMLSAARKIVVSIVTFVLLISTLIFISAKAFLILSAIIPISAIVSVFVSKKIRSLSGIERDAEANLLNILTKSVQAFKMVSGFSMVPNTVGTFSHSLDSALNASYKKSNTVRMLQGANDLTMVVSDVCSIFVGAILVFQKKMTLGSFIGFMNAFWRSATTLISIFSQWADLQGYSATIDRLIVFMTEDLTPNSDRVGIEAIATAIHFSYGAEPVLSNFSMHIKPTQHVLIIGKNGSGKTTLANILSGHLHPSEGQLKLPVRISAITLPVHFPPVQTRKLPIDLELLARLGIDEPSLLDAEPDQLSAGQQQKVALALALTCDSDLYVLDEPLANLDEVSRERAMFEIQKCTSGRMLVMIMHKADEYKSAFDVVYNLPERREALKNVDNDLYDSHSTVEISRQGLPARLV